MNNKKIKILYIIPSLASGGAEKFILDLINNLDKNIFEINLLVFNGAGFFLREVRENNINCKILNKKYKIDFKNFYQIYKYIKQIKPDIVHTQLGGDIYGKISAKLAGIKYIISTEQNVNINDNQLLFFLKKQTARFSNKIVAISTAVKNDLITKYKLTESKVELIFNAINLEQFINIKKVNKQDNKIIFGSIGRLGHQKNFSLLLKALKNFKDINFQCFIVGEGHLRPQLENEIMDYKLESKVKLLGLKNNIPEFLSSLDFFVLPSKWEGLGVVLLEAGALSLPVLASSTGGILDVIEDQKTGILFENNNLEDLKEKLEYFFDEKNKENLADLGNNLNKKIKEKFDIKIISQKYSNIYLNLLKDNKK